MTPNELDQLARLIAHYLKDGEPISSAFGEVLDAHGAADLLGVSLPTIERRTKSGELPSFKLGRLRRYRRSELLRISANTTKQG